MGTRTNSRQGRRATRRGLASFVSFLLLFAFALGQSSLSALADDAGTSPVAAEEVGSDGSTGRGTLPVRRKKLRPRKGSGAEEEAPVAEAAAEALRPRRMTDPVDVVAAPALVRSTCARVNADAAIGSARGGGPLSGGDVSLDFVAAGPFTYNHATGLGSPPQFGYDNRTISKTNGVVESLEGGDFECGDLVTFFVQVKVDRRRRRKR